MLISQHGLLQTFAAPGAAYHMLVRPKHFGWFVRRGYRHLDTPLSPNAAKALVENSNLVSSRSTLPFIKFSMETPRFDKQAGKLGSKQRDIYFGSHKDAAIFSYYGYLLSLEYEKILVRYGLSHSVLAYRATGKTNIHFAIEAFSEVRSRADCVVLCFDVSNFFDSLRHDLLKLRIQSVLGSTSLPDHWYQVYKSMTKFSWVELADLKRAFPTLTDNARQPYCTIEAFRKARETGSLIIYKNKEDFGIPQGSPISAIFSNVYMIEFDRFMLDACKIFGASYLRYSDDILVICDATSRHALYATVASNLAKIGLTLNSKKYEEVTFYSSGASQRCNKPLQYLGLTFDGKRVLIRSSSIARFSMKMLGAIRNRKRLAKASIKAKKTERMYTRKLYARYSQAADDQSFIGYARRIVGACGSKRVFRQLQRQWVRFEKAIAD